MAENDTIAGKVIQASSLKLVYDTLNKNKVDTTDARLSDARTPLAHTHTMGEITDWATIKASLDSEYVNNDTLKNTVLDLIPTNTTSENKLVNESDLAEALEDKVSKDGDKVLTDVNFSAADKAKLDGIEANANKYELPDNVLIDNVDYDKVIISKDIVTRFTIGAISAGLKDPKTIVSAGATLKDFIDKITTATANQPIKTDPVISISFSSTASDEEGTEITSISYSITTTAGSYSYDDSTGVTWSKYTISGGCAETEKTSTTGTITLANTYTVGTSSAVSFNIVGTHSAGTIAHDDQGNDSNPIVQIAAGTASNTGSFSKTAKTYPYIATSDFTAVPTSGTKCTQSLETSSGQSNISFVSGKYLWVFSQTNSSTKAIQIYSDIAKSWADALGGTVAMGSVTFTKANGKTKTYYAYRTNNTAASSTTATVRFY